jgi:hypothetical protein
MIHDAHYLDQREKTRKKESLQQQKSRYYDDHDLYWVHEPRANPLHVLLTLQYPADGMSAV